MLASFQNWIDPMALAIVSIGLLVMIRFFFKKKKAKKSHHKSTDTLTNQQKWYVLRITPTSQLDLMEDVLLVSLAGLFDQFHKIKIDHRSLFEMKYEQVIQLIQKFNATPGITNTTATVRSRTQAILIFAFYRTLFFDVIHEKIHSQVLSLISDPWIFLKRIPTTIHRYVGSQTWRLYELKTLIAGSLDDLELNKDIAHDLQRIFDYQPSSHPPSVRERDKIDPNAVKTNQVEKVDNNPHMNPDITENTTTHQLDKTVKGWLMRQVKRYPINSSNRFYMDIVKYGKHTLFISDIALSDLSKKLCKPVQDIQKLLIEQGICHTTRYVAKLQSGDNLNLLRLTIDDHDEIEVTKPMDITIEEIEL
jgi:hypothetical protein